jgi:SAM-dependent methyltransferase
MNCNICGKDMIHLNADLFKCVSCSLISSILPADLTLYDKSYYTKYVRYQRSPLNKKISEFRADFVQNTTSRLQILDFGCGSGAFLEECEKRKIPAVGFDINPHSPFCDITRLFNGHVVVTFWDSLEHVTDPVSLVKGLASKYVYICAPSTDDFTGKDLTKWHHYYPGEHLHYFNHKSLSTLLSTCGYRIFDYSYDESKYRTSGGDKNILTVGAIRFDNTSPRRNHGTTG